MGALNNYIRTIGVIKTLRSWNVYLLFLCLRFLFYFSLLWTLRGKERPYPPAESSIQHDGINVNILA